MLHCSSLRLLLVAMAVAALCYAARASSASLEPTIESANDTMTITAKDVLFVTEGFNTSINAAAQDLATLPQLASRLANLSASLAMTMDATDNLNTFQQAIQQSIETLQDGAADQQLVLTSATASIEALSDSLEQTSTAAANTASAVINVQDSMASAMNAQQSIEASTMSAQQSIYASTISAQQSINARFDLLADDSLVQSLSTAISHNTALLGQLSSTVSSLAKDLEAVTKLDGSSPSKAARVCRDILAAGVTADGTYWLQPSSLVTPFQAYCDMTNGGWTLVGMVHRCTSYGVNEPNDWFVSGFNRDDDSLKSNQDVNNRSPCAHGRDRFLGYVQDLANDGERSILKIVIHAEGNFAQQRTWYKQNNPNVFTTLLTTSTQGATPTCYNEAMNKGCFSGIIGRSGDVTSFEGYVIRTSDGGSGDAIGGTVHMRQNSDGSPEFSAVCSSTGSHGGWSDSAQDGHWGNPLRIWLR
eukprot:m.39003 g.39003  ORF g.39003 m.39003 type:complete len:474 (+) comp10277_c0_seq1:81-1502(+)